MKQTCLVLVAPLAFAAIAATQTVISPVGHSYATTKGNSVQQYPFSYKPQHVCQQVHGDLIGTPMALGVIRFRQGGYNSTTSQARNVTCELWVGDGDQNNISTTYANNYVSAPTLVMASRTISVPAFTSLPAGGWPAPFSVALPFDNPYPYSGNKALTWELRVTNIDFTDWTYFDYHAYNDDSRSQQTRIGTGCLASTTTNGVGHYMDSYLVATYSTQQYSFQWRSWYGVANAPSTILLGLSPADTPVPGLCSNAYVSNIVATLSGVTPSSGHWVSTAPKVVAPYNPSWVGFKIYSQTLCVDANQAGGTLPVCVSRGEENVIPAMGPAPDPVATIRSQGSATATSGQLYNGSILITAFN